MPAELRRCFAYLSFSLFGVKNKLKSRLPSQVGTARIARRCGIKPVARSNGLVAAEAYPLLQFIHERRIVDLGRVALNDELKDSLHRLAFGQDNHLNAFAGAGLLQQFELMPGKRFAVILATRTLALGYRLEQRRCDGFCRLQNHTQCIAPSGVEAGVPHQSIRQRRLAQVFGSTTEGNEKW